MRQVLLKAEGLRKSFSSNEGQVEALRDVSLSINSGEVFAFLGPNGAGKTTTIRILTGLVQQDSGTVLIDGRDPMRDAKALELVGTVLEGNRNLYWRLTALENLKYFAALKGIGAREATLRGFELLERFDLSAKERAPVQTLSRGMQQKVAIAVALIHQPKILLLDEPTLGLDAEAARDVKQLIRDIVSSDCGVLLTTHQLDVAEELSERVSILCEGEILFEESTREIIRRFSGESYTILVDGKLNRQQVESLEKVGGFSVDDHIVFRGNPEGLYHVLNALRPLPILKVEKDEASLTDVFLKLIKEAKQKEKKTDVELIFGGIQA